MHRVDGPGHLLNQWTQGNPITGVEPTEVTSDFMNAVQEEIANVIENTGASLNKADNTQLLQAVTSGLINPWANRILNGQFYWWQRDGWSTADGAGLNLDFADNKERIGPDRWILLPGDVAADANYRRREFPLGTVPIGMEAQGQPQHYLSILQNVVSTAVKPSIRQRIEGVRTFAGTKVSVSFVARVASGTLDAEILLTQHFGTSGSPSSAVELTGSVHTITTTWQRYTSTFTLAPLTGKTIGTDGNDFLEVGIQYPVGVTPTFDITDVRIGPGSTTNNTILLPTWAEFVGISRYYEKSYRPEVGVGFNALQGQAMGVTASVASTAVTVHGSGIRFSTVKRVAMEVGPAILERASGEIRGLQRIWRSQPTLLGSIDFGSSVPAVTLENQRSAYQLNTLNIASPAATGTQNWNFQWDADAEIVLSP